jgi:hypothetical protein
MKRSRSKFNNVWTVYNDIKYQSKAEANYAEKLDKDLELGLIKSWSRQVPMKLIVNGELICKYICDFVVVGLDDSTDYIDVKGIITDTFRLKCKLVKACLGITLTIVKS